MIAFRPIPIDEEPLFNNRYSIFLPKDVGIECHHVEGVSSFTFNFETGRWNDVTITIMEMVGGRSAISKLMDYFKTGRREAITINLLDGPGICVNEIVIDEYDLLQIVKPELHYGKDEITKISLNLRPKVVSMGYGHKKIAYGSEG